MGNRTFFAALFLGLANASVLLAQEPTQGISVDTFDVSERGSDWFVGDSLDLRGSPRPAIGVVGAYGYKPLVLYDEQGNETAVIIKDQVFTHVGASLVLAERLRLAANLPIALVSNGSSVPYEDTTLSAASGPALGDMRVSADLRLFGRYGTPITMAVGAQLYLPTGDPEAFTGDGKIRLLGHLAVAGRVAIFAYSARASLMYRAQEEVSTDVPTGTTVLFAASAGLSVANHQLVIGPELWGSTVVVDGGAFDKETTPFELLFGVHYRPRNFRFGLGAGPGLTRGLGTPQVRVVGTIEWAPSFDEDRDHDGIIDDLDACPDVKGVPSPDPKKNGCPRTDRDKDGIFDEDDACPDHPGPPNEDPTKNGCPLPPDRDDDGIIDREDDCPDVPGPASDVPGHNGCPDTDGDTIIDPVDACPTVPGPADPDPTKNGCPKARIEKDQIVITERVEFKTDSAELLPSSSGILEAVLTILREHDELTKVLVEGHTDNVGDPAYNKRLSDRRAKSVVSWLVSHGVPKERLDSAGLGLERPIDSNSTAAGRQRNRRVEFHIVESADKQRDEEP
jgi:OmpA-OmpF porin, OOP family